MSMDREPSRDREGRLVRHQHSFDLSRHIPMWDSSDPDRAPPPLPLNPNPSAPVARPNASAHIQAAAEALSAKARESITPSPYTSNAMPDRSPDRSLIKGAAHRRLQSLQTPSVKDLRSYLDGSRSPERSPERTRAGSITPGPRKEVDTDFFSSPSRAATPTPASRDASGSPERRASSRPPPKAILGENTPPSATMLALQTYPIKDYDENPLTNITNGSSPRKPPPDDFGVLSTQITSLTTICTKMQTEMDKLSRRSKDNATDLVSLKEATNSRDEDIRKSLRELMNTLNNHSSSTGPAANLFGASLRGSSGNFGSSTPPPSNKFSLPKIPSPSSLFDDRVGSPGPNLYSVDGMASVAMLEKIIREMVTKENQDNLLSTLSQLFDKASKDTVENSHKMEEMFKEMKSIAATTNQSRALIPCEQPAGEMPSIAGPLARTSRDVQNLPNSGAGAESKGYTSPKAADFVSDEMIKLLKKIKESVTQSGGLLGEVKAQQRDLRGEVLHMGREIARKIDETRKPASGAKAIEDGSGKQDIARIVQEGLAELKTHLDDAMREKRRQSSGTTVSKSSVNSQEVYDVVRHTLSQHNIASMVPQQGYGAQPAAPGLDKEAILNAIKEAYEEYKPDVQVEQYGLERHEILDCLREGLEQHKDTRDNVQSMSRIEIMEAIQDAMRNFQPPAPINEANELREEILMTVRECLDEFKPSLALMKPSGMETRDQDRLIELTRQVVLEAVKSGLASSGGVGAAREIEISQEDLYSAVSNALNSSGSPFGRYGEQVVSQLHELVENMRGEFKDYSSANGRDTEQVLDAMKDGLESLRNEIELYVDRAQDVTQKDDIIDALSSGLDRLGHDVQTWCAAGPQGENAISRTDMLEYMKKEFELLHQTINDRERTAMIPSPGNNSDILGAIDNGFDEIKSRLEARGFSSMSRGEVDESLRDELELLRDAIVQSSSVHKDEVLDSVRGEFNTIHGKIDGGAFAGSNEEVLRDVKEELEHLRETLATSLAKPSGGFDTDVIRDLLNEMREQIAEDSGAASREVLGTIQNDLEQLRETMGSAVVGGPNPDKEEILQALRSTADSVQQLADRPPGQIDEELLGAIRGEFEILRSNVANGFSRGLQTADREDLLEAMRLGFDDLRSDLIKKIENPEPHMKATGELLDALNEGLEGLKSEVNVGANDSKPIDMTVSYEILDTLKDGISNLRADIAKLKAVHVDDDEDEEVESEREAPAANAIVLAESDVGVPVSREVTSTEPKSRKQKNFEKLEVMLAQVQVKVDAMDANITDPAFRAADVKPAEDTALKTDLQGIEQLLRELQGTVDVLASREEVDVSALPKKEDMDAIETLLSNTKARLDEFQVPDLSAAASREQMESVESLMRSTREAVDELSVKIEDGVAKKEHLSTVETLIGDLRLALDDLKAVNERNELIEGDDKVTKTDVDAVGIVAIEIKEKLDAMQGLSEMPSKSDIESLKALVHDFRDSHEKLKENYESDVAVTAKAFDDRMHEAENIVLSIDTMKSYLTDVKEELKSKLDVSAFEATTLSDNFKILEKTVENNFNVMGDVKELMDIVTREFERIHGTFDDVKVQQEQKSTEYQEKHDASKEAVIAEVVAKLDEKFDIIMSKYDDAQRAAEDQVKNMEERTAEQQVLLQSAKEVSDDLKLSVDTLGTTLTAMESHFSDIGSKISSESETVFAKLETVTGSLEDVETHGAAKEEHERTREEIAKTLDAINGVSAQATEFHPQFLVTLQEVQALIQKHYEHSQKAHESVQEHAQATSEQSRSIAEEIKTTFSGLPALLPPPVPAIEAAAAPEPYDDSKVHEKLGQVLEGLGEVKDASAQLERLDKIHQQVMMTAAEVSTFVATQTRLIDEGHESKQREAEEMALLVERRTAEKEHLEKAITELSDEKESLLSLVLTLQSERDALAIQKSRLATDVAAMQTALHIRQEELESMDAKAHALERRVLEGIMDQSRLLYMSKGATKPASNNARMASNVSHSTIGQLPTLSAAGQGLSMALKKRPTAGRRNVAANNNPAARRVMSLNPISHNTPTGAQGFNAVTRTTNLDNGFLKRSQSVRSNKARKVSWNSAPEKQRSVSIHELAEDKENDATISEVDSEDEQHDRDDTVSESGTERRLSHISESDGRPSSSYAGSVSEDSERPTSRGTVMTGTASEVASSYMTGSDVDRRTSYASTGMRSTLGADTVIDEEDEDEDELSGSEEEDYEEATAGAAVEEEEEPQHAASFIRGLNYGKKDMVVYAAPSDSGLGTDCPTAMLSGEETDYFRRKAEETGSEL